MLVIAKITAISVYAAQNLAINPSSGKILYTYKDNKQYYDDL